MARTQQIRQSNPRICSYCECTGHNKATCVFRAFACSIPDPNAPAPPQSTRICSYCGCGGHDLRNCLAHLQLTQFHPEIEEITTPEGTQDIPSANVKDSPKDLIDLSGVSKRLIFKTPSPPRRVPRLPQQTKVPLKSVQMIDPEIYDEPWVWCTPVSGETRPKFNRAPLPNPPPCFLIFT